jgi:hypothetical protein
MSKENIEAIVIRFKSEGFCFTATQLRTIIGEIDLDRADVVAFIRAHSDDTPWNLSLAIKSGDHVGAVERAKGKP